MMFVFYRLRLGLSSVMCWCECLVLFGVSRMMLVVIVLCFLWNIVVCMGMVLLMM